LEAERHAAEEADRAAAAARTAEDAAAERAAAASGLAKAQATEREARAAREAGQRALADAESGARIAAEAAAGARAAAAALAARHADAQAALATAEGSGFARVARARGGRSIADGLIIEPPLQAAVDAALAGVGRAHVLKRGDIAGLTAERGVAVAREAIDGSRAVAAPTGAERIVEVARARGGGPLAEAIRRDDAGAVTALLARAVWLPTPEAALQLQPELPAGWVAVARDGSLVVGEVASWVRPEGRGLHLKADVDRLAGEATEAEGRAAAAREAASSADDGVAAARAALLSAREAESVAVAALRRAEELDRAAGARTESAARDAAWLAAQSARLQNEAARLRASIPAEAKQVDEAGSGRSGEGTTEPTDRTAPTVPAAAAAAERRLAELRERRDGVAARLDAARAERAAHERARAQAEASTALAERQLAAAAATAADIAAREARLLLDRDDVAALLADAERAVAAGEATLATVTGGAATERERLRAAEQAAASGREATRIAGERARLAERDDVEARLGLEGLHEQLLVELAGLGGTGLAHLRADAPGDGSIDDVEPEELEAALAAVTPAWAATPPAAEPPSPGRLATLRRRFHDLGAVNPFAADEYEEVKARLDTLEQQRTDIQAAIDSTRELIGELDRLVADQFRRTFEALERAFDARFQQLFGGGYARLTLTDPDDLASTGVEITARPPGKKAQALAMLSGGERALTAVALLFAMLTVRPVPFCVLDEVDAALDEANIGRFTEALQDLARGTQCIVITHNRGTIEAADALYGVTVGDDSASRVISLRLDEATAMAGRSSRSRDRVPADAVALAPADA
jgi:chromosome segregation protein